jgi:hypothetical protein
LYRNQARTPSERLSPGRVAWSPTNRITRGDAIPSRKVLGRGFCFMPGADPGMIMHKASSTKRYIEYLWATLCCWHHIHAAHVRRASRLYETSHRCLISQAHCGWPKRQVELKPGGRSRRCSTISNDLKGIIAKNSRFPQPPLRNLGFESRRKPTVALEKYF